MNNQYKNNAYPFHQNVLQYSYYPHSYDYRKPPQNNMNENVNKTRKSEFEKENAPQSPLTLIEQILEKLKEMEDKQKELQDKIEDIKPLTIENINYKIQDLNVQELSGTLLVGLSTISEAEELKKLLTENGSVHFNDVDTDDLENGMVNGNHNDNNNEGKLGE